MSLVTSIRVEQKAGAPHAQVTVWIRGANVGTLTVREDEVEPLRQLLTGQAREGLILRREDCVNCAPCPCAETG